MMKAIDEVFTKYPFFGSRQIAAYLRRKGTVIGRHRVRRLMTKMGLVHRPIQIAWQFGWKVDA